jgi:glucose-6-phosphate 1-dehydrogenase
MSETTTNTDPSIIVIFGITGDLAKRKLLPALYNLMREKNLHEKTVIVGVTRQNITAEELFNIYEKQNDFKNSKVLEELKARLVVHTMDITSSADYKKLRTALDDIEAKFGLCMNRLYYLSIPPQVFGPIVRFLGENKLNESCSHNVAKTSLLVEKPFGYDIKSAEELITETSKYFSEEQIYRIDHYLAKDTVQNILTFRFFNSIFESVWDCENIASIHISALEDIGIEGRVTFYEQTGALRDLIQSHLLQLLSVVAMEKPKSLTSNDEIHASRLELLKSVETIHPHEVASYSIRGQYDTYRKEVDNPKSNIETYAALRIRINNKRWKDVPIIISTGKSLDKKSTMVKIVFSKTNKSSASANSLTFRIQPDEGISLGLYVKKPVLKNEIQDVDMDFNYDSFFKDKNKPDAYQRILVDAIKGDHDLFATSQEVMESWRIVEGVLTVWSKDDKNMHFYKNNSPESSNLLSWLESSKP